MSVEYYSTVFYGELANPSQWPQLRKKRRLTHLRIQPETLIPSLQKPLLLPKVQPLLSYYYFSLCS